MRNSRTDMGADLGLLGLRVTTGGYLMAHGAQKLFGAFGGHGIEGTGGMMEGLGMSPGEEHAILAGATELGSGVLTAAGALSPLGPIAMIGPMAVAAGTAHRGKGPFVTQGGWELPVTDLVIAAALAFTGPGRLSADSALGIRLPRWVGAIAFAGVAAASAVTIAGAIRTSRRAAAEQPQEEPDIELSGAPVAAPKPSRVEEPVAPEG